MARAAPIATNKLLERLPAKDRAQLLASCERVELPFGQVLDQPGAAIRHVYFPTSSFVSLLAFIGGTQALEVALAGSEGAQVTGGVVAGPVDDLELETARVGGRPRRRGHYREGAGRRPVPDVGDHVGEGVGGPGVAVVDRDEERVGSLTRLGRHV